MSPPVWRAVPLRGSALIEASAGTGKTYQIALVVLRLLLEGPQVDAEPPRIEQILVCTFTDAAATELRQRIRERIVRTQHWLEDRIGPERSDPAVVEVLDWLDALQAGGVSREILLQRLRLARLQFDSATISTIHGWCARVQRDWPLLIGSLPAGGTLVDESALLDTVFADYRRQVLQTPAAQRPPHAAALLVHADDLLQALQRLHASPDAVLDPPDTALLQLWDASEVWLAQVATQAHLQRQRQTLLRDGSAFGRRIDEWLAGGGSPHARHWKDWTHESLRKALNKGADPAQADALQRLADLGERYAEVGRARFHAVLADAHAACLRELERRLQSQGHGSYRWMIERVHRALSGAHGTEVASTLAQTWPHALIDEFQDTDARQYQIFQRIYAPARATTSLHLIGDPKQAIYGFRGGDLHAYLGAAAGVESRQALTTNWRSSEACVHAVNALYACAPNGFRQAGIEWRPSTCGGRVAHAGLTHAGLPVPDGLALMWDRTPISALKDQSRRCLEHCAEQIVATLQDPHLLLGGAPLRPGQIAVLAPRHQDLHDLARLLRARGVPCRTRGPEHLGDQPVLADLSLLLAALLDLDDPAGVRAALATDLLGFDLAALHELRTDAGAWMQALRPLREWRELWLRRGVLALVEAVAAERAAELVQREGGMQRLADLRHVGEWLQLAYPAATPAMVLARLQQLRDPQRRQAMETAERAVPDLRPRTTADPDQVQLLTTYAAKGLEFPLVFLPTVWHATTSDAQVMRYHDAQGQLRFDVGSAAHEAHAQLAASEHAAEALRLLYVALTRAVHRTVVYGCAPAPRWSLSGLHLLLADIGQGNTETGVQRLAREAPAALSVVDLPTHAGYTRWQAHLQGQAAGQARLILPAPRPAWLLHSFSGLVRRRDEAWTGDPQPAADESGRADLPVVAQPAATPVTHEALLALAGWRGAAFGNAVHHILERAAPGRLWPAQRALVQAALQEQGLGMEAADPARVQALGLRLQAALDADLGEGLRLARLAPADRVVEFEFHFPLHGLRLGALRRVLAACGHTEWWPDWLDSSSLRGLMTGSIDLVLRHQGRYRVVDYKTNWLGADPAGYAPAALAASMQASAYALQALIYGVALHRHLLQRLRGYAPARHHAGATYLYLRALGLAPGLGLVHLDLSAELLLAASAALGSSD